MSESDPVVIELEAKYGPAPPWRRKYRPERDAERDADRAARERERLAQERRDRGEAPYGDDLPF